MENFKLVFEDVGTPEVRKTVVSGESLLECLKKLKEYNAYDGLVKEKGYIRDEFYWPDEVKIFSGEHDVDEFYKEQDNRTIEYANTQLASLSAASKD